MSDEETDDIDFVRDRREHIGVLPASAVACGVDRWSDHVGEELGGSAFLVAHSPAHGPFAGLAARLESLHWSSPRTASTVKRYLTVQTSLFAL
ncbi:MAG TPA: hypothetical protein VHZ27_09930, partial [Solirubrobacteraceae bacterium]|nr:hypothetical protein [Solirubrobacteraceae bacterium]